MRVIEKRRVDYDPKGPPPRLTDPRLSILDLLQDFRYLPQSYIGKLLGYHTSIYRLGGREYVRYEHLRKELWKLRKQGGWLRCPDISEDREAVYALTTRGEDELTRRGMYRGIEKSGKVFTEELASCMVRASFHIGAKEHGINIMSSEKILRNEECPETTRGAKEPFKFPVNFSYTTPKTKKHEPKTYNIDRNIEHDCQPFGLWRPAEPDPIDKYIPGMEIDMDTEGYRITDYKRVSVQHHLLGILAATKSDTYKKHLGIPNALIPFVCVGAKRMEGAMKLLDDLTDGKGAKNILFAYIPDFRDGREFPPATGWAITKDWLRAGTEDDGMPLQPFNFLEELQ
jgi:hypothetical protein